MTIGGLFLIVLAWAADDRGFKPLSDQIKDYRLVFVGSPLSMQL